MSKLTKAQLDGVVKMQLLNEMNCDIRPYREIVADFPAKVAKSVVLTAGGGTAMMWGCSLSVFRKVSVANDDALQALPALGAFGVLDSTVNFGMMRAFGKRLPDPWICVTSSAASGAAVGYAVGSGGIKPTLAGGLMGAAYGYMRAYTADLLGADPF